MLWISDAKLAAAVSNAGGMGTLGVNAGGATPTEDLKLLGEQLRSQIRKVRELTDKPFAVNIILAIGRQAQYSERYLEVVIEERIPAAILVGDGPEEYTQRLKKAGIRVLHRALDCTVQRAKEAEQAGVDALIVTGYEAGGHSGPHMLPLFVLIPQVVDTLKIPVIAAGGISDGRGMVAAMALGAEGIYVGTRFIATRECPAHLNFKRAILEAKDTSTLTFVGPIGSLRCMRNPLAEEALGLISRGGNFRELEKLVYHGKFRPALLEGDLERSTVSFGAGAGMIKEILSVPEVMQSFVQGWEESIQRLL